MDVCSLIVIINTYMNKQVNELHASEVQLIYRSKIPANQRVQICSSADAHRLFLDHWDKDTIEHVEEFKILLLNNKNIVLGIATTSKGGTTGTVIDPRIIFQYALKAHASAVIFAHNHPSNNPVPSEADIQITKKLTGAGAMLDVKVLDHIIVCGDGTYYSFADEGKL